MAYATMSRSAGTVPSPHALARGLGWFSIALGVTEMLAPKGLSRSVGLKDSAPLIQAYGLREIATGIGILSSRHPSSWLWARVGGDALDMATLAAGLSDDNPRKPAARAALVGVAVVTAVDVVCARALQRQEMERRSVRRDYSGRVGFPRPPALMRGAAKDAPIPEDMRTPKLMRWPREETAIPNRRQASAGR